MKLFSSLVVVCLLLVSCNHDDTEKPVSLQDLKQALMLDSDYQEFVALTKEIKLMIAEKRVNVEEVAERARTQSVQGDFCSFDTKVVEGILGGTEYVNKSCEKHKARHRLFEKYPYLKDMSSEEQKYLLYSGTRINVDPNELITKRKNNEK